jgi:mannose-6-phosphate isomerase-like protein (cupin superfamily)
MQSFVYSTSHKDSVEKVDVARWEQYSATHGMPFKAMWYSVPPNAVSPFDRHPEIELSMVLRGTAVVETADGKRTVEQGDGFLLGSGEGHTVHNTGDEPLLVFSAYWMPEGGADA